MSLTREEQLINLHHIKSMKEGQIRAYKWAIETLKKQKEREFGQLRIIEEDIKGLA